MQSVLYLRCSVPHGVPRPARSVAAPAPAPPMRVQRIIPLHNVEAVEYQEEPYPELRIHVCSAVLGGDGQHDPVVAITAEPGDDPGRLKTAFYAILKDVRANAHVIEL